MSYHPDTVPPALEAAIRDILGGIDHVNVERVRWERHDRGPHPVAVNDDSHTVIVRVKGWSPTLHRVVVDHELDLAMAAAALPTSALSIRAIADMQRNDARGVATLVSLATAPCGIIAAEQRMNAGHAARLGIHRPHRMASASAVRDGQRIRVGHLLVDRSAAAVLRADCGDHRDDPSPRRTVEDAIAVVHEWTRELDNERQLFGSMLDRVAIHSHLHGPTADLGIDLGGGASVIGDTLTVDQALPDTVLAACAGRPLSDLVEARPEFAGRIIASAREWVGTTRITLEPDLITIDQAFPPRSHRRRT